MYFQFYIKNEKYILKFSKNIFKWEDSRFISKRLIKLIKVQNHGKHVNLQKSDRWSSFDKSATYNTLAHKVHIDLPQELRDILHELPILLAGDRLIPVHVDVGEDVENIVFGGQSGSDDPSQVPHDFPKLKYCESLIIVLVKLGKKQLEQSVRTDLSGKRCSGSRLNWGHCNVWFHVGRRESILIAVNYKNKYFVLCYHKY